MLFRKDHWHPGMDPGDKLVWLTGDDCARVQPFFRLGIPPTFPETCKYKRAIVLHADRLHADRVGDSAPNHLFPFVESVRWYQAASLLEGLPIRGCRIDCCDPRIDRFVANFRVFGPIGN